MTLTQLEYIVSVDTFRHFGKAAEKCFITQPTLSMQINKLEKELGVIIFDRMKHPTIPTEIGKQIIEQARLILQESKKINQIVQNTKDTIEGEIRLGIIPTLAPYLLPLFINDFLKKYPKVKIYVEELITEQIIEKLKHDLFDLGIVVTPVKEKGLLEIPLFYESILAYVSTGSSFSKKKTIKTSDLKIHCNLWVLNKDHCFSSQVINLCSQLKKTDSDLNLEYQSGSLETLIKLVDSSGDLTLLPELAVNDLPAEKKLLIRKFADISPVREVSIITHRSFVKKELIQILKKEVLNKIPVQMKNNKRGLVVEWK